MQLCIDGKWVRCLPAEDFGFIGVRHVCDLSTTPGQPNRKLLIRNCTWPQVGASNGTQSPSLDLIKFSKGAMDGLRPVLHKTYQQAAQQSGGKPYIQPSQVLQQDITGLFPLRIAILRAVNEGHPERIWRLFFNACEALDRYSKLLPAGTPVRLQCPGSLAVGPDLRVVPLDAELQVNTSVSPEAQRAYRIWFGDAGSGGLADQGQASILHANALLRYFQQLLGELQQKGGPGSGEALGKLVAQLGGFRSNVTLLDLEESIRDGAEDWNIYIEDEVPSSDVELVGAGLGRSASTARSERPKKKRSVLLRLSLWLNLLLTVAIAIMILLWPKTASSGGNKSAGGEESPTTNSVLMFSSYCVVLPTQGTIGEKVNTSLQELFPGKVTELSRPGGDRDKLMRGKMDEVVKSLGEPEKLKDLLVRLAADHSVRFKGFLSGDAGEGLAAVIERGGIFTFSGDGHEQHGSLLQASGMEIVLKQGDMEGNQDSRALLISLKKSIVEYASLKDALGIVGERQAFLIQVDPTAAAHEEVRKKLLSRLEKPVFVSRPLQEFFDAVDPTADVGGGTAAYSLQLDRKSYWRLASLEDRKKADFKKNTSNDRMKWQAFDPGQLISWRPIPVKKMGGKTDVVATFDIAVVLDGGMKVVVFRNQSILVGESRQEVLTQGRDYITRGLNLRVEAIEDAISVRKQDEQYTGALRYSYLAEQATNGRADDLQVMPLQQFDKQMKAENEEVRDR
jgi:hypothetical protein